MMALLPLPKPDSRNCLHSICGAHLLRDLTCEQEQEGQVWAGEMKEYCWACMRRPANGDGSGRLASATGAGGVGCPLFRYPRTRLCRPTAALAGGAPEATGTAHARVSHASAP